MAPSRSRLSWLLYTALLGLLLSPVNALYFYLDGTTEKCFYEELPKDTLVVGMAYPVDYTYVVYISHFLTFTKVLTKPKPTIPRPKLTARTPISPSLSP